MFWVSMFSFSSLGKKNAAPSSEPVQATRESLEAELIVKYEEAVGERNLERAKSLFLDILGSPLFLDADSSANLMKLEFFCEKNLGRIEEELGNLEASIKHFVTALEMDEEDVALSFRVGELALLIRKPRLARIALETGLTQDPQYWPSLSLLAELLFQIGDGIGCMDAVNACIHVQSQNERALWMRRELLKRLHRLSPFEELAHSSEDPPEPMAFIGDALAPVEENVVSKTLENVETVIRVTVLTWSGVCAAMVKNFKNLNAVTKFKVVGWSVNASPKPGAKEEAGKKDDQEEEDEEEDEKRMVPSEEMTALFGSFVDFSRLKNTAVNTRKKKHGDPSSLGGDSQDIRKSEHDEVSNWLQVVGRRKTAWDSAELVDEYLQYLFIEASDVNPFHDTFQKNLGILAQLLLGWNVPAKPYFLHLAETLASAKGNAGSLRAKKLLERYCLIHSDDLAEPSETAVRVERLKGVLCKSDNPSLAVRHWEAAISTLNTLDEADYALSMVHCRYELSLENLKRDIASVGNTEQILKAKQLFRQKEYEAVIEILSPLLLDVGDYEMDLSEKNQLKLLETLQESTRLVRNDKYTEMKESLVLELMKRKCSKKEDINLSLRQFLNSVTESSPLQWSSQHLEELKARLAFVIGFCLKSKSFAVILVAGWTTFLQCLSEELRASPEYLDILSRALDTVSEIDACRLNKNSLLRLAIAEFVKYIPVHEKRLIDPVEEDRLNKWYNARDQAIQCCYDVKIRKGGHHCRFTKASDTKTEDMMGDAYTLLVPVATESDLAGVFKKVHSVFSRLPQQWEDRLDAVQRVVAGELELSQIPAELTEETRKDVPYAHVFEKLYYIRAYHLSNFWKPMSGRSRSNMRTTTAKSWFGAKAEELRKILLMDVAVSPSRIESWHGLGVLCRPRIEHLLCSETSYLNNMSEDTRAKVASLRQEAICCFRVCLMQCDKPKSQQERHFCSQSLIEMALQVFAVSRLSETPESRTDLLVSAETLVQKAKEVEPTWLAYFLSGLVRKKLKLPPSIYLEDFHQALQRKSTKDKSTLFMLHGTRLKLLLDNADMDVVDSYSYAKKSNSDDDCATRLPIILEDIIMALQVAFAEDNSHRVIFALARAFMVQSEAQKSITMLQRLFAPNNKPSRLSSVSQINIAPNVVVGQLEGFGLTEQQVNDKKTCKALSLYFKALEQDLRVDALYDMFQKLYKQCEALVKEPHRQYVGPLQECAVCLLSAVQSLEESQEDHSILKMLLDLRKKAEEPLLKGLIKVEDIDPLFEHMFAKCPPLKTVEEGDVVDLSKSREQIIADCITVLGSQDGEEEEEDDKKEGQSSPNYSVLRKTQRGRKNVSFLSNSRKEIIDIPEEQEEEDQAIENEVEVEDVEKEGEDEKKGEKKLEEGEDAEKEEEDEEGNDDNDDDDDDDDDNDNDNDDDDDDDNGNGGDRKKHIRTFEDLLEDSILSLSEPKDNDEESSSKKQKIVEVIEIESSPEEENRGCKKRKTKDE